MKNMPNISFRNSDYNTVKRAFLQIKSANMHSPPTPRAIIPDARPLGTFENQDGHHKRWDALYLYDLTEK